MAQQSGRLARFAYTSLYFILLMMLAGLTLITPGNIIERSIVSRQVYNIWILLGSYAVTIVLVAVFYSTRLYVNKTVLAGIPKPWVPIQAGDVNKTVHLEIVSGLDRSAAIAYESRPRVTVATVGDGGDNDNDDGMAPLARDLGVSPKIQSAMWSSIEHEGWASPASADFPSLQYMTVLAELPNLIEAKALTLAPPASAATDASVAATAAHFLQRPIHLSLRGYLDHLCSLGVVAEHHSPAEFLEQYEYARFSTRPISSTRFRRLMHLLAELLGAMQPLDLAALEGSDAHSTTTGTRSTLSRTSTTSSSSSSILQRPPPSLHATSWATAPSTPRGRRPARNGSIDSSGGNTIAFPAQGQAHHLYSHQGTHQGLAKQQQQQQYASSSSSSSTRSAARSQMSVIRLATVDDDERLPYVLNLERSSD
ncbi:Thermatolerance membrane protein Dlt1 [Geosmithia morbida]|uniref:Defect at low temperature protein 1 n=1 Tax=Geosmithia morbida TaxID=1094350 RepID=A0A9P5D7K7_9HYPO|nr:Thermatolerance membrane protein Dlt1 [Geosmithia morbida]KAF4125885.1 Thermatolerance membrane protein Dlt1 [Geosmithia morbida]